MVLNGPCPACEVDLDIDKPYAHEGTPDDGDVTICAHCHAVLWYVAEQGQLARRVMPQDALDAMPTMQRSTLETALAMLARGKPGGRA